MQLRYILSWALLLSVNLATADELLVVSGYGLENKFMNIEESCPPQALCFNSWYKYKIIVKEALQGEVPKGNLVGVKKQHAQFVMMPEVLSVFVLRKIKDKALKKKLGSDYLVVEFSYPKTIYCFNVAPQALGG